MPPPGPAATASAEQSPERDRGRRAAQPWPERRAAQPPRQRGRQQPRPAAEAAFCGGSSRSRRREVAAALDDRRVAPQAEASTRSAQRSPSHLRQRRAALERGVTVASSTKRQADSPQLRGHHDVVARQGQLPLLRSRAVRLTEPDQNGFHHHAGGEQDDSSTQPSVSPDRASPAPFLG